MSLKFCILQRPVCLSLYIHIHSRYPDQGQTQGCGCMASLVRTQIWMVAFLLGSIVVRLFIRSQRSLKRNVEHGGFCREGSRRAMALFAGHLL